MGLLFKRLFDEVQRSNMSKACATSSEAEATCAHYRTDKDTECSFRQVGDKFVVYRGGDDKVLKSVKYSQVNFAPLLSAYVGSGNKSPKDVPDPTTRAYDVPDCLNDVRAFHDLFQVSVLAHPEIPGPKRCDPLTLALTVTLTLTLTLTLTGPKRCDPLTLNLNPNP